MPPAFFLIANAVFPGATAGRNAGRRIAPVLLLRILWGPRFTGFPLTTSADLLLRRDDAEAASAEGAFALPAELDWPALLLFLAPISAVGLGARRLESPGKGCVCLGLSEASLVATAFSEAAAPLKNRLPVLGVST